MKSLIYSTFREGYGPDQVRKTMTVGELIVFLEDYDEDTPVYLSFDNGYTYGGINREEFIALMESEGYKVRWETSRRNITYTTPSGWQCRDRLLFGDKYLKENMEYEFRIRKEIIYGRAVGKDLYERAQELMEARTMHHNEVPFNSKGKALLSGMVYCAHCGSKLVLTTSSGRRAKGEPKRETRIRYACHYKIRHPQDCDGQTGYSGEKLDGIIDKIVIQLFERMKTAPRSQLIQKQREKELQLANSSVANLEKLHAAAERELESYKKEIIKTINGTGSFGADILGEMIEDTRSKLAALAQELEQAKEKAADLKSSAVAVQKINY